MVNFDNTNWKYYKIHYIIIIIIVIILLFIVIKHQGCELKGENGNDGDGTATRLSRGSEDDSIEELLNRLDWSSNLNERTSINERYFVCSIIVVILIIIIVYQGLPKPGMIIILFIIIFLPFYAFYNYFYVHGDIYNNYYIKKNVDILRSKLDVEAGIPSEPKNDNIPTEEDVRR